MSAVTVLGLGNMGFALARVFVEHGHAVTVWNRSPEKAAPLVAQGAALAPDVASAVAASPLIILCLTNYAVAQPLLDDLGASWPGKLLVQLSTGTPAEARATAAWAQQHQVDYLEGKITGSPRSMGTPQGQILLSGPDAVFQTAEPFLRLLAPRLEYKGGLISLASAWDMVMIMHYYGMFLSLFHSIQICQSEGIPLEQFSALLGEQGQRYEQWLCENIRTGSYQDTSAPLELWAGGIERVLQQAQASGIDAGFPRFTSALFQKAMAAGYGREEVSALYKILHPPATSA
jgi:3-hydroxyisobutyrate dehydrogenase-like beta-hydroxyacid dehydrogenase